MYTEEIKKLSEKYYEHTMLLRHQFHMYPELAFEEIKTSEKVVSELEKLNIKTEKNIAKTGVTALIKGKYPGKTILLRADMDALKIQEETTVDYKSKIPNKMHACGHDGHTAGLLGTAMILNELKNKLHGNVKLLFQPAEEGTGGAKPMINEGVLENPKVDACFACHLWSSIPEGKIKIKKGPIMASSDDFSFEIIGKGGHGALPHLCIDPISLAVQAINTIQISTNRKVNPLNPFVLSFCSINGGESYNVIPSKVEVKGTLRTFDNALRNKILENIESILKALTFSHGANYTFKYSNYAPPVINDAFVTTSAIKSISKIIPKKNIIISNEMNMGSEDFAWFGNAVPSSFFFIGIGTENNEIFHHHPKFMWNDKNLLIIMQTMSQIAIDCLCE